MRNLVITLLIGLVSSFAQADLAEDLLKASDRSRGSIKSGLIWDATVVSVEGGRSNERSFKIQALGNDAYVEANRPQRNKGEVYIFNDRNMWFFKPSLKRPVSISARQRLVGQAANGDIASTHYARDYSAVIEKTETDPQLGKIHILMLTAKSKNLTYDKIRYWISDKTRLAVRAEFLTIQGKPLKIGTLKYDNILEVDGERIPFVSELTIRDAKNLDDQSTISYANVKLGNVNSNIFNVNNLTR
jgi:outer membrane lipoprotein-sorting protein